MNLSEKKTELLVQKGALDQVQITPDSLKAYLDKRLGSDARMTDFSYDWEAQILKQLGFSNLSQVDECIKNYNDDNVNYALYSIRQGQITRFDYLLLAGMGKNFFIRHKWSAQTWFQNRELLHLKKFTEAGIPIGSYDPKQQLKETTQSRTDKTNQPVPSE